jgi:hypothetical protein
MMIGVNVNTAMSGTRLPIRVATSVLALVVVVAGGVALWYRQTYNVWPGQGASTRVRWCGRDYENSSGTPRTWRQISAQAPFPIQPVGQYPPLFGQELYAALTPAAQRDVVSPPLPCTMAVYLRTGADRYLAYSLEGGP